MDSDKLWTLFQIDQQRISSLDGMMIAIRGWTVALVAAISGYSLSQDDRGVLLVGMGSTVLFLYLDMRYRRTQLLHARRASKLESKIAHDYLLREGDSEPDPGLSPSLLRRYRSSLTFYGAILVTLVALALVA